jgi:putative peptidoglycan lipid II flippase
MFERVLSRFWQQKDEVGGLKNLVFHTALALTLTSGLSYFLGLIRDRTFARTFGAGADLDVYNAAFVVPDFFLAFFVTSGLAAAFVPIFTGLDERGRGKAVEYTNQVLSYALVILVGLSLVFAVALPSFADFLVPGFDEVAKAEYVKVTRLMLFSPLLFTVSNTFGDVLISIKEFFWYGLAPAMYNIGIIIGVFVFVPHFGVMGLVMGTILGAALHLSIRIPSVLRYGFRFRLNFKMDENLKETVKLMAPKMFQIGMWQILLWWFIRLASQLPEGSITIYSFARNFQSVPVSLIGIAIALSAFASLSHIAAKGNYKEFKRLIWRKSGVIVGYTALAAVALGGISFWLIDFLLGGGKFDHAAVQATAALLIVYCVSVPLESVMHLLARAHYALKNTLRPSGIHIFTIILTMIVSAALLPKVGLYAIPISFAGGLAVQILLLILSLRQLIKIKEKRGSITSKLKSFFGRF